MEIINEFAHYEIHFRTIIQPENQLFGYWFRYAPVNREYVRYPLDDRFMYLHHEAINKLRNRISKLEKLHKRHHQYKLVKVIHRAIKVELE